MGNVENRKSKIEAWGVILASNAGLNSSKAPIASHLSVSKVEKKEWAGHCTAPWEQQSSSPPCTPYPNEILKEISHEKPVGMAFRQKAPNFANLFFSGKGLNFARVILKYRLRPIAAAADAVLFAHHPPVLNAHLATALARLNVQNLAWRKSLEVGSARETGNAAALQH
jgi:hypothetical protein